MEEKALACVIHPRAASREFIGMAEAKVERVREEAGRRLEAHMKEMQDALRRGEERVMKQKELLKEKVEMQKRQRELLGKARDENVERLC